jgi:hypothetical protein
MISVWNINHTKNEIVTSTNCANLSLNSFKIIVVFCQEESKTFSYPKKSEQNLRWHFWQFFSSAIKRLDDVTRTWLDGRMQLMKTLFNKSQVKRKTNMTSKEKKKKKTLFEIFLEIRPKKTGKKLPPGCVMCGGFDFLASFNYPCMIEFNQSFFLPDRFHVKIIK